MVAKYLSALLAAALGLLVLPATVAAQADSWVGSRILIVRPGVWSRHSDEFGRQVRDAELTDLVYTVLNEQDDFLWVRHRAVESWVPRAEVVPLDEAVSFFSERIRFNSSDAYAFALRGRAWREEGELERALKDLNEAVRLDPKNAAWYANRALVQDDRDESARALDDYAEAIRLNPNDAQFYNGRGVVHKRDRKYDEAIRDYTQAIRLDPKLVDAYFNRGNAYKAKRDYEAAIRDYSEAIRLDPEAPDVYFNRANAHRAKHAYAQAAADLKTVIRLDAKDADAHSSLAWLLATCPEAKVRDGRKAVEHATRACELTSWKAPYFLATLAAAQAEAGEFTLALQWQQKALETPRYERDEGAGARARLQLFKDHKPYREE